MRDTLQVEREVIGTTHARLGGLVAGRAAALVQVRIVIANAQGDGVGGPAQAG